MLGKQSSKLEAAVARSTVLDGARQGPDQARRRSQRLFQRCERLRDAHACLLRTAGTGQRGLGEGKSGLVSSRESRSPGGGECLASLEMSLAASMNSVLVGLRITRLSSELLSRGCLHA